jgi:hypothetical protein
LNNLSTGHEIYRLAWQLRDIRSHLADFAEKGEPLDFKDSRWLVYVSDESGRNEVYVQPFSLDGHTPPNKWPISSTGGTDPRWRRDGKELFYLATDGKLMSVGGGDPNGEADSSRHESVPVCAGDGSGRVRWIFMSLPPAICGAGADADRHREGVAVAAAVYVSGGFGLAASGLHRKNVVQDRVYFTARLKGC